MLLIVGLGNPGRKYENTRHNIGSRVVDELHSSSHFSTARVVDELHSSSHFSTTRVVNELKVLNLKNVISVKPSTFMNESGMAVKNLLRTHHLKPNNLIVIHDDIDLPIEKIRIVKNRGAAGHKGVESIIKELGTKNFIRFRIGIYPKTGKPKNPEKFVLEKFNKKEEKIVEEIIKKTVEVIEFFLKEGLEKAMNKFNK